jgi:hypothetical protein
MARSASQKRQYFECEFGNEKNVARWKAEKRYSRKRGDKLEVRGLVEQKELEGWGGWEKEAAESRKAC